jgi:CheY-like chemotaxis protein
MWKAVIGPSVLVVAEIDYTRQVTADALRKDGFQVDAASSAVEAFRRAEKQRPAAIVAQWKMSGYDGTELLFMIRTHAELQDLPFVLLAPKSPWYAPLSYLKALPWQADAYVLLPCDACEVVREVRALVAKR